MGTAAHILRAILRAIVWLALLLVALALLLVALVLSLKTET
jgi:hypothetical protein